MLYYFGTGHFCQHNQHVISKCKAVAQHQNSGQGHRTGSLYPDLEPEAFAQARINGRPGDAGCPQQQAGSDLKEETDQQGGRHVVDERPGRLWGKTGGGRRESAGGNSVGITGFVRDCR